MLNYIILGAIQGITEWLPVSSSAFALLFITYSGGGVSLTEDLGLIAFLHLGTFFSALTYFRKDVFLLLKCFMTLGKKHETEKPLVYFLTLSTIISASLGYALLEYSKDIESFSSFAGTILNAGLGALLLITGFLVLYQKQGGGNKTATELATKDGVFLGLLQGLAAIPGISRSGITVAGLLYRGYSKVESLRISFLMSLPIVFGANIALYLSDFEISTNNIVGMAMSFIFGLLTIHALIRFSEKVNLGYFVLFFAILLILTAFLPL